MNICHRTAVGTSADPFLCYIYAMILSFQCLASLLFTGTGEEGGIVVSVFPSLVALEFVDRFCAICGGCDVASEAVPPQCLHPYAVVIKIRYLYSKLWQEFMRQVNANGFQSLCHSMYDNYFVVIKTFDLTWLLFVMLEVICQRFSWVIQSQFKFIGESLHSQ